MKVIKIHFLLIMVFACNNEDFGDYNENPESIVLKHLTVTTYPYKNSVLSDHPKSIEHWEYNEKGLLSKYILDNDIEEYFYNDQDLLVEMIDKNFASLNYKYSYEYNAKNQCKREITTCDTDPNFIRYVYFTYDQNDFLVKTTETWSGASLVETFYKNQFGLDTLVISDHSSQGVTEYRYKYDFMGNILMCDLYEINKNLYNNKYINTYEYDNDGKLLRKTTAWNYGFNKGSHYSYEYSYLEDDSINAIDIDYAFDDLQLHDHSIEIYEYEYY